MSTNAIDRRIGDNLRQARKGAGLSQEALGEKLGVTFQQVQKYEKGVNRIAAGTLWQASCAIGVPIERFFSGLLLGARRP